MPFCKRLSSVKAILVYLQPISHAESAIASSSSAAPTLPTLPTPLPLSAANAAAAVAATAAAAAVAIVDVERPSARSQRRRVRSPHRTIVDAATADRLNRALAQPNADYIHHLSANFAAHNEAARQNAAANDAPPPPPPRDAQFWRAKSDQILDSFHENAASQRDSFLTAADGER